MDEPICLSRTAVNNHYKFIISTDKAFTINDRFPDTFEAKLKEYIRETVTNQNQ